MDSHIADRGPVEGSTPARTERHRTAPPSLPTYRKKDTIAANLTINEIRKKFSDAINRVSYGDEHIALTRRGQTLALIVPAENVPPNLVTETIASADARNDMSDVINRVHYGKAVLAITRKAKTLAVLLTPAAYQTIADANGLNKPHATLQDLQAMMDTPQPPPRKRRTPPHPS